MTFFGYVVAAATQVLKLGIIGGVFFLVVGGPLVLFFRWFPGVNPFVGGAAMFIWGWLANRFLLSPLEYSLGLKSKQYDPWYENRRTDRSSDTDAEPAHRPSHRSEYHSSRHFVSAPGSSIVFFERTDTFRRWDYVFMAVVFDAMALLGLIGLVSSSIHGGADLLGIIFGTAWTLGMVAAAAVLSFRVFLKPIAYARVDESGICADGRRWPWDKVACVYAEKGSGGQTLCFRLKGPLHGFRHPIHAMPPLSEDEVSQTLERLRAFLAERFPEVSVK